MKKYLKTAITAFNILLALFNIFIIAAFHDKIFEYFASVRLPVDWICSLKDWINAFANWISSLQLDLGTLPAWITACIAILALAISRNSFLLSNKANKLNIRKLALDIYKDSISHTPLLEVSVKKNSTKIKDPKPPSYQQTLIYSKPKELRDYWESNKTFRLSQIKSRYIEVHFKIKLTIESGPIILNMQSQNIELMGIYKNKKDFNLLHDGSITLKSGEYTLHCKISSTGEYWASLAASLHDSRNRSKIYSNYFGFDNYQEINNCINNCKILIEYSSLHSKNIRNYWHVDITASALKIVREQKSYKFSQNYDIEQSIVISSETDIQSIEKDILHVIGNDSTKN